MPRRCPACGRSTLLDGFSGGGGAGEGYRRAGFCTTAVDKSRARLAEYPRRCPGASVYRTDAVAFIAEHGHEYAAVHVSPTCTGYSRGTAAIPDRLARYDRLIGVTREACEIAGRPYVIENVEDARPELRDPIRLCGKAFGLGATDTDGTRMVLKRHRLFESNVPLDAGPYDCPGHPRAEQVAGVYGGARRDKVEARLVRKGGYVPPSVDVLRALVGIDWLAEPGLKLAIPPVYTEHVGRQLLDHVAEVAA